MDAQPSPNNEVTEKKKGGGKEEMDLRYLYFMEWPPNKGLSFIRGSMMLAGRRNYASEL